MVLTKEELIASLQHEMRVVLHLAGKIEPSYLEYRPTPGQRSLLELLQYVAIMGNTQIAVIRAGVFDRPAMSATWGPAVARSKEMSFEQTLDAIRAQSDEMTRELSGWTDEELRSEVEVFGNRSTRGFLLANLVLAAFAAYRMQLFLYLKSCGRTELSTMNLWMGVDPPPAAAQEAAGN